MQAPTTITEHTYPTVYNLLSMGDTSVSMQDIITDMHSAGLTEAHLPIMEASLFRHPRLAQGLPFPGDEPEYDALLKSDVGVQLLQKFMDAWH